MDGYPFRPYADAGSVLERAIRQIGMTRDQFGLYNILACQPPGNSLLGEPYEQPAISHCVPRHLAQVYSYYNKPRVIVALGATPTRVLTGLSGERMTLDLLRGFPLEPKGSLVESWASNSLVIPTYHPAFIVRGNQALMLVLMRDLQRAVNLANNFAKTKYKPEYLRYVGPTELRQLKNWLRLNPHHPLSYDYETPYEEGQAVSTQVPITQVNFSLGPGNAIVCDWTPQTAPEIVDIMACTPNPKFGHNVYHFDEPVSNWNGFEVRGSRHDDSMQSFHFVYPDLPGSKGGASSKKNAEADDDGAFAPLQFCASFYGFPEPWKHLFKIDPHSYGAYDADSAYWVRNGTFQDIQNFGSWNAYNAFIVELRRELRDMERRGVPGNERKLQELSDYLLKEITESQNKVQIMVPADLKELTPVKSPKGPRVFSEIVSRVEGFQAPTPNQVAKDQLNERERQFVDYVSEFSTVNKDNKLVGLGFKVARFDQANQKCSCLTLSYSAEPTFGCKRCFGSGDLDKAAKSVPCECRTKVKASCDVCKGFGLVPRFKSLKALKDKCPQHSWTLKRQVAAAQQGELFDGSSVSDSSITKIDIAAADTDSSSSIADAYLSGIVEGVSSAVEDLKVQEIGCSLCGLWAPLHKFKSCPCIKKPSLDCEHCQGKGTLKAYTKKPCLCRRRYTPSKDCPRCYGSGLFTGQDNLWAKIKPFNVSSTKQMMRYAQIKGYRVPMNSKRKIAMDKETVKKMAKATGDPIFSAAQNQRELVKIRSAYALRWLASLQEKKHKNVQQRLEPSGSSSDSGPTVSVTFDDSLNHTLPSGIDVVLLEDPKGSGGATEALDGFTVTGSAGSNAGVSDNDSPDRSPGPDSLQVVRRGADESSLQLPSEPLETGIVGRSDPKGSETLRDVSTGSSMLTGPQMVESFNQEALSNPSTQVTHLASGHLDPIPEDLLAYHLACEASGLGTVHTSFGFKPATGQLNSQNPNVQVLPSGGKHKDSKLSELAPRFRECVQAPDGYTLVEADFRAFHVLTLGYEAQDPDYIRLARLDTHSFLAANFLGLPGCDNCLSLPDNELAAYLKMVKKNFESVRNGKSKGAVLGYGFGMGAAKLYDLNQDSFNDFDEARRIMDMLNALFPRTAQYRLLSPEQAHRQSYLRSSFGCIRWFMQVKVKDGKTDTWKHGQDWEKSIAFRPANHAFCILKLAKLRLRSLGLTHKYNLINNIHDAILFCCPNKLLEECLYVTRAEMQRPVSTILGPDGKPIWCEVEAKIGKDWAKDMKEYKYSKPLRPDELEPVDFDPKGSALWVPGQGAALTGGPLYV